MLQDVLRRWDAGPREFRLRFEVEWKGRNLSAIEVLISGGTVSASDWALDAAELNLVINTTALKVERQSADFAKVGTTCLSLHAIGRYFQRQPDRNDADLLRDLAVFSRIVVSPDAPEQEVRYASEGGAWVADHGLQHRASRRNRATSGGVHPDVDPGLMPPSRWRATLTTLQWTRNSQKLCDVSDVYSCIGVAGVHCLNPPTAGWGDLYSTSKL